MLSESKWKLEFHMHTLGSHLDGERKGRKSQWTFKKVAFENIFYAQIIESVTKKKVYGDLSCLLQKQCAISGGQLQSPEAKHGILVFV